MLQTQPVDNDLPLSCSRCPDVLAAKDGVECASCATRYHRSCAPEGTSCEAPGCEGSLSSLQAPAKRGSRSGRTTEIMRIAVGLGLPAAILIPLLIAPPERAPELVFKALTALVPIMVCLRLVLAADQWRRDRAKGRPITQL